MPDAPALPAKAALRAVMHAQRAALPAHAASALSEAAQRRILESPVWRDAAAVGAYYPLRHEMHTHMLLEQGSRLGKQIYLPRCLPGGAIQLLPYRDSDLLVKGAFGILEPDPAASPSPPLDGWIPDLMVVPGLAFDRTGVRLGAGAGYYDRLFSRPAMSGVVRLGLAYAFQIVPHLPADAWDIPMHGLCTEEALLWLNP
jgi:5-formyltetrahydrofolate cyclo-ligase